MWIGLVFSGHKVHQDVCTADLLLPKQIWFIVLERSNKFSYYFNLQSFSHHKCTNHCTELLE